MRYRIADRGTARRYPEETSPGKRPQFEKPTPMPPPLEAGDQILDLATMGRTTRWRRDCSWSGGRSPLNYPCPDGTNSAQNLTINSVFGKEANLVVLQRVSTDRQGNSCFFSQSHKIPYTVRTYVASCASKTSRSEIREPDPRDSSQFFQPFLPPRGQEVAFRQHSDYTKDHWTSPRGGFELLRFFLRGLISPLSEWVQWAERPG